MSSTTRVYKKTAKVIRANLTGKDKKLILKFLSTHKKNVKKATKDAAKQAKISEKEEKKAAKMAEKEEKKAAKKATKKAEGIKRKPTAFANYMKMTRSSVKSENPDASFGDISKIVGGNWKKLSDEDKQQFKVE